MIKHILSTACLTVLSAGLFAQSSLRDSLETGAARLYQPKKYHVGLSLGSEFTSVSGFGSGLTTRVAPTVSYNVSKRFQISGGISIATTNYFDVRSFYGDGTQAATSGNFTSATLFVSGSYLVNDRLTVTGSAFKMFPLTSDPLPYNPFNPVSRNGAQGIDFNVGYRIGNNMHIQAGFRYTEGVNPYYNDPFGSSPYMHDPFGAYPGFGSPRW
jgi:hypothetical protein